MDAELRTLLNQKMQHASAGVREQLLNLIEQTLTDEKQARLATLIKERGQKD